VQPLWTPSLLNGLQEIGGLPKGTSLQRRDPLALESNDQVAAFERAQAAVLTLCFSLVE